MPDAPIPSLAGVNETGAAGERGDGGVGHFLYPSFRDALKARTRNPEA